MKTFDTFRYYPSRTDDMIKKSFEDIIEIYQNRIKAGTKERERLETNINFLKLFLKD